MTDQDCRVGALEARLRDSEKVIAVLQERLQNSQDAAKLQVIEYERLVVETDSWREQVQKTLTLLEGRSRGLSAAQALLFQILPLIIAATAIAISLWM